MSAEARAQEGTTYTPHHSVVGGRTCMRRWPRAAARLRQRQAMRSLRHGADSAWSYAVDGGLSSADRLGRPSSPELLKVSHGEVPLPFGRVEGEWCEYLSRAASQRAVSPAAEAVLRSHRIPSKVVLPTPLKRRTSALPLLSQLCPPRLRKFANDGGRTSAGGRTGTGATGRPREEPDPAAVRHCHALRAAAADYALRAAAARRRGHALRAAAP